MSLSTGVWAAQGRPLVKRVALYGASEVAEIAYVCLQDMDLVVTAVFDGNTHRHFFGTPVYPLSGLGNPAAWSQFDVLMIMSFEDGVRAQVCEHLRDVNFPPERVFWL